MCQGNTAEVCEGKFIANVNRWVWVGCQEIHLHRWLRRHEITTCSQTIMERHPDLESVYYDLNMIFDGGVMREKFDGKVPYKLNKLFGELVKRGVLVVDKKKGKLHWPSWTQQWLSSGWNGDTSPPLAAPPASPTLPRRQPTPHPISIYSDEDDGRVSVVTSRQTPGNSHGVPPTFPAASSRASAAPIHQSEPRRATRETTRDVNSRLFSPLTQEPLWNRSSSEMTPAAATLLFAAPTHQPVSNRPAPLTEAALRKKNHGLFVSAHGQPMTPPTSPPSIRSYGGGAEEIGINTVKFPDHNSEDYYQSFTPSRVTNNRGSTTSDMPGSPRPRTRLSTTQIPEPHHGEAPSSTPSRALFGQRTPFSPGVSHLSGVTSSVPSSIDDEEWEQLLVDHTPSFYDGAVPVWDNIIIRPSNRWNNPRPSFKELVKMMESVGFTVERNDV